MPTLRGGGGCVSMGVEPSATGRAGAPASPSPSPPPAHHALAGGRHHRRCRSSGAAAHYASAPLPCAASGCAPRAECAPRQHHHQQQQDGGNGGGSGAQQEYLYQRAAQGAPPAASPLAHSPVPPAHPARVRQSTLPCRAAGRHRRSASVGVPAGFSGGLGAWWGGGGGGGGSAALQYGPPPRGLGGGGGGSLLSGFGGALGSLVAESLGGRRPSFCLEPGAALARSRPLSRAASSAGCLLPACLICLDTLTPEDFDSGEAIEQACKCRGDVALRHRRCAVQWSLVKRSLVCDVCRAPITNLPPLPLPPDAAAGGAVGGGDGGEEGWDLPPPPGLSDYAIDVIRVCHLALAATCIFGDMSIGRAFGIGALVFVVLTLVAHALVVAQRSAAAVRAFATALRERAWAAERAAYAAEGRPASGPLATRPPPPPPPPPPRRPPRTGCRPAAAVRPPTARASRTAARRRRRCSSSGRRRREARSEARPRQILTARHTCQPTTRPLPANCDAPCAHVPPPICHCPQERHLTAMVLYGSCVQKATTRAAPAAKLGPRVCGLRAPAGALGTLPAARRRDIGKSSSAQCCAAGWSSDARARAAAGANGSAALRWPWPVCGSAWARAPRGARAARGPHLPPFFMMSCVSSWLRRPSSCSLATSRLFSYSVNSTCVAGRGGGAAVGEGRGRDAQTEQQPPAPPRAAPRARARLVRDGVQELGVLQERVQRLGERLGAVVVLGCAGGAGAGGGGRAGGPGLGRACAGWRCAFARRLPRCEAARAPSRAPPAAAPHSCSRWW